MVPQKDPDHYEQIQNVLLLHCPIFVTSTKHYIKSMDVRFRFHHHMVYSTICTKGPRKLFTSNALQTHCALGKRES